MNEDYIFKINNAYVIRRSFNNIEYNFGTYDSFEEAKKIIDKLNDDGWPINTKNINEPSNQSKIEDKHHNDTFLFDIKVGKAYKHGFLVLTRKECYDLFPKQSYENECEIILDGIESKARLNFVPRLVIDRKNEELINHLKNLSEINPNQRRKLFLIKQKQVTPILEPNYESLIEENKILKEKIRKLNAKIEELYEYSSE